MLKSMTGYGKGEAESGGWSYSIQIKSVNNRFLEAPLKLPAALWSREAEARAMVQKALSRGKLDLNYRETAPARQAGGLRLNMELANAYLASLERLAGGLGLKSEIRLEQIARFPEVISASSEAEEGGDSEARWEAFKSALALALEDMQQSRQREGEALGRELGAILARAKGLMSQIEAKSAELVPLFHDKLKKRIASIVEGLPKDDPRLVTEAAMLADKADVREETVRFATHVAEFERLMQEGGAVGKRLDFLSQELLREANTMGSKSPDAGLTQKVVSLKAEVEKIKEQIQNLE
jgi:uncharacterized protein (TIGR00255 family)